MGGEQLLREADALAAKDEVVAVDVAGLGVRAPRLLGEEVQAGVARGQAAPLHEVRPAVVDGDVEALPVAQARASQRALVERKAEGAHEVQARARDHAGAPDVSRVGRDLRRHEHDVEHGAAFLSKKGAHSGAVLCKNALRSMLRGLCCAKPPFEPWTFAPRGRGRGKVCSAAR